MKKDFKIYQKNICIDSNTMNNQMILIFTENGTIIGLYAVPYPSWLKFYDDRFVFYPVNYN